MFKINLFVQFDKEVDKKNIETKNNHKIKRARKNEFYLANQNIYKKRSV